MGRNWLTGLPPGVPAAVIASITAWGGMAGTSIGAGSAGSGGGLIAPVTQTRALSSMVIVPPCGPPTSEFDSDSSTDFGPYEGAVHAQRICDVAQGIASAHQQSTIQSTALTANGTANSSAAAMPATVIHAISSSTYEVKFELHQAARFRLTGQISSGGGLPVVSAYARLRLQDARLAAIVAEQVQPGPGGAMTWAEVDQVLQLSAGAYTLTASAASVIDATVPPAGTGDSAYIVALTALDPADLDHDGDVDGIDLALLLGGWGGCPLECCCCCCPTDLNCDGVTNGLDIALLLGAWNP